MISLMVTLYMLLNKGNEEILAPDYAKPEIEENAEPFDNQNAEPYEQIENGGAVDIIFGEDMEIDLSKDIISFSFGNPKKSNHDMLIQIVIQESLVAESGMIQPGNRVSVLNLHEDIKNKLIAGLYDGEIRVYLYDCVSAEKAMVDVKIPVTITVNN